MIEYSAIFERIIKQYTDDELQQICKTLNRIYNIYDSEGYRWTQLQYVLTKTSEADISALRRFQLSNQVINDLILRFYPCERVVKYYLIKKLRTLSNQIVAFEMSIGNSRIDLCRINGHSYAYEIKTSYDTFDRLDTQMADYMDTFEKVYLVIPFDRKDDAACHIPENCGIITYRISKNGELIFHYLRKANTNMCDIRKCISSLSSADISQFLKLLKIQNIPTLKDEKLSMLFSKSNRALWSAYKKLLKIKYAPKWDYLIKHFSEILPIDMQNFFSTSLNPSLAYYTTTKEAGQS